MKKPKRRKAVKKSRIEALEARLSAMKIHQDNMQMRLNEYREVLGPMWTTQNGHKRPLGMLSTEHLRKLVDGDWLRGWPHHINYAQGELERRRIDKELREMEKKPSLWKRFWDHGLGR
jgi:hypothetical protein